MLPWFVPAAVLSLLIATVLAGRVGRSLMTSTSVAWLLVVSLGWIVAATLTPSRLALEYGATSHLSCDLSRVMLLPLRGYLRFDDPGLNVLLFMPLGFAVGLLPRNRWKIGILVVAILLSPAIETTQLLVPALDRACQTADVVDNLTGLALGLVAGNAIGLVGRWARRER